MSNDEPLTKSQTAARAIAQNLISSAATMPEQVSELTFQAIRDDQFYIYPHPAALALVKERSHRIVSQINPSLVFEGGPSLNERSDLLKAALAQ